MKRAFYIGRFQPYHLGHHTVVGKIAAEVDELIIGIGSAQISHCLRDPFTAGERVMMIRCALEDIDIPHYVLPIEDVEQNSVWVAHILSRTPSFDVVYSNNPLVMRLFEEADIEVRQVPMYRRDIYSGTIVREKMIAMEKWESLVSQGVAEVINGIDGVVRLQSVGDNIQRCN